MLNSTILFMYPFTENLWNAEGLPLEGIGCRIIAHNHLFTPIAV